MRLNSPVVGVGSSTVQLAGGERIRAKAVVVATEGPGAHRLLGDRVPVLALAPPRAAGSPWPRLRWAGHFLVLDGEGIGPALNLVVMSEVQRSYAPGGRL